MRRMLLALLLVTAACSSSTTQSVPSTTATSVSPPEPTTTEAAPSDSTTTTTTPRMTINRNTVFEPGVRYVGDVPVQYQLAVRLDGWQVEEVGMELKQFVEFFNDSDDTGARAAIVLFRANSTSQEIIDYFVEHPAVAETTDISPVTVGGHPGLTVDVSVPPNREESQGDRPCEFLVGLVDELHPINGAWTQDVVGCSWNRIWAIELDDFTITLTVGPNEREPDTLNQIEEFRPFLDDFINGIVFCTRTSPCD